MFLDCGAVDDSGRTIPKRVLYGQIDFLSCKRFTPLGNMIFGVHDTLDNKYVIVDFMVV